MIPAQGQRIRLLADMDDLDPIKSGATGTVIHVTRFGSGANVDMKWDSPYQNRNLALLIPEDTFEIIKE